jgi:hypothetical protein
MQQKKTSGARTAVVKRKYEPPSIEEALFAAEDLTDDREERIALAAALMGVSSDAVRAVADRLNPPGRPAAQVRMVMSGGTRNTISAVVVEHKRPLRARPPRPLLRSGG